MQSEPEKVNVKDLEKGCWYRLTYDFWPDGGKPVRFVKFEPESRHYKGGKGNVAVVKGEDGTSYIVSIHSYLFAID
jgi:hypothetical protein